jgi:hypothetical protein
MMLRFKRQNNANKARATDVSSCENTNKRGNNANKARTTDVCSFVTTAATLLTLHSRFGASRNARRALPAKI